MKDISYGLIGHWTFDGHAEDFSGNANNVATMPSDGSYAGYVMDRLRRPTRAFYNAYDAVTFAYNSYTIPHNAAYNVSSDFSLVFWVSANSTTTTSLTIAKSSANSINVVVSSLNVGVSVTYRGTTVNAGSALSAGSWTHVAITKLGTALTVYINGTAIAVGTVNAGGWTGTESISVSPTFYSGGTLDDLRLYNRALSAMEVTQLYNNTNPGYQGLFDGCTQYWDFKGGSTTDKIASTALTYSGTGSDPTFVADHLGVPGSAISIMGGNKFLKFPAITAPQFSCAYVFYYPGRYADKQDLLANDWNINFASFQPLFVDGFTNYNRMQAVSNYSYTWYLINTAGSVAAGNWNFVALTRDLANQRCVQFGGATYDGGVVTDTQNYVIGNGGNSAYTQCGVNCIGGSNSGSGATFSGYISSVMFWNRILADGEIFALRDLLMKKKVYATMPGTRRVY